jgi:pilus assembly protein CpaB
MKTSRLPLILLLALVTGSSAGYLAWGQVRQGALPAAAMQGPRGQVRLAVAARDIPLGAVLAAEDVRLVDWPGEVLPIGYAGSAEELVGRGVLRELRANEPIMSEKLADRDGGGGLPILIPKGMRAVSVRVDEVVQVAGFVTAGTRVDVLVTLDGNEVGAAMTRVILQNVQVLAAGQKVERDREGTPFTVTVITLLVSPTDAERLTLATSQGRIQLALRGMMDTGEASTAGARLSGLVQSQQRAPQEAPRVVRVAPSREDANIVETFRGGVRTLTRFQD